MIACSLICGLVPRFWLSQGIKKMGLGRKWARTSGEVFQSTEGSWSQVSTNREFSVGVHRRRKLYPAPDGSAMMQHGCEAAPGPRPSPLLQATETSSVSGKSSAQSSVKRDSTLPEPRYGHHDALMPDWSILMQMKTPSPHHLIGWSKRHGQS